MEMALYYPRLGYYARETAVIGTSGDFYTAPHTHPIFGAAVARQLEEMWRLMGIPAKFSVVEMGAGSGRLTGDILDYLDDSEFYRRLAYVIVEPNASYVREQQALLGPHSGKIEWFDSLEALPLFEGCLLSNELVDALPVRLVEITHVNIFEIYVDADEDGNFIEIRKEAGAEVVEYLWAYAPDLLRAAADLEQEDPLAVGATYRTEANLKAKDWLSAVASRLESGFVLTIDYGFPASEYYLPFRNRGTLIAYQQHQAVEDPYGDVGLRDLTAHVNFSSLHTWGEQMGLASCGFCSQGPFLASLGIDSLVPQFVGTPPDPVQIAAIKNLIMPQGMGETHKVMIQRRVNTAIDSGPDGLTTSNSCGSTLSGFKLRNEKYRLLDSLQQPEDKPGRD